MEHESQKNHCDTISNEANIFQSHLSEGFILMFKWVKSGNRDELSNSELFHMYTV